MHKNILSGKMRLCIVKISAEVLKKKGIVLLKREILWQHTVGKVNIKDFMEDWNKLL
jgi:hypothetical protein